MSDDLIIRLGPYGQRYCFSPRHGITLLGSVQQGQAIGALAQRPDGRCVQLNGDFERVLNTSRVNAAMQKQQPRRAYVESTRLAPPPVVTIKRRRVLVPQE